MQQGQSLIDAAAEVCGSRYALAKRLGANESFLSRVARGKQPLPPALAAELAAITGDDPIAATLTQIVSHEKDAGRRMRLTALFRLPVTPGLTAGTAQQPRAHGPSAPEANSAPLYIMSSAIRAAWQFTRMAMRWT